MRSSLGLLAVAVGLGAAFAFAIDGGCLLERDGLPAMGGAGGGMGQCGDGQVSQVESCDGANLDGKSCKDFGFRGGALTCTNACTFDTAGCDHCKNNVLDPGEQCDGATFSGDATCESLGFAAGKLVCTPTCAIDKTPCYGPKDWFDASFAYRRLITVDHALFAEPLDNFALLVHVKGLAQAAIDGSDLLFVTPDGMRLPHEVESFTNNELLAWVSVPKLSALVDTTFYLYYGNPTPPALLDPTTVWDGAYTGVWHLGEEGAQDTTSTIYKDATGHGRDGKQNKNHDAPGKIGNGQAFRGSSNGDYIEIANPDAFSLGNTNSTVSAWMKTGLAAATDMGMILKFNPMIHEKGDRLFGLPGGKLGVDDGYVDNLVGKTQINDGNWHHVVWTQQKDAPSPTERWVLYVDGQKDSEKLIDTDKDVMGHRLQFGAGLGNSFVYAQLNGTLDEVRISAITRSVGWVSTSFANQSNPDAFFKIGAEQPIKP